MAPANYLVFRDSADRLAGLSAEQLQGLQQNGFLLPTFMAVASTPNMGKLVRRKNRSLGAQD